ncbi:MAG TPA: hypothetical protein DE045_10760 [Oceanospirillaceae bacterium]|nr:hypothetical protein [Oceanospirillaceae bacterium]
MTQLRFLAAVLVLALTFVAPARGAACSAEPPKQSEYLQAIQLGFETTQYLEKAYQEQGDMVVLIARIGSLASSKRFQRQLSPYWQYTHAGLVFRDHPSGQWSVVHLLNTCGGQSAIFEQGLMRFSLDKPDVYVNAIVHLKPQLQGALAAVVIKQNLAQAMFQGSQYSSISYPYSLDYQNSNEYILMLLAAAMAPESNQPNNRQQSMGYFLNSKLKAAFQPELVKVGVFESLGSSLGLGPSNATLKDHTRQERRNGKMEFVSVGSLVHWLTQLGQVTHHREIHLNRKN